MISVHYPGPLKIFRGDDLSAAFRQEIGKKFGRLLLLTPPEVFLAEKNYYQNLLKSFSYTPADFSGECTDEEVERVRNVAQKKKSDMILVTGGGKAIDTAKAVAESLKMPLAVLASSSSTCAAYSHHAVFYTREGVFDREEPAKNPDFLFLDYTLLLRQPFRLLAAGIGDALAKYYERKNFRGVLEQVGRKTAEEIYLAVHARSEHLKERWGKQGVENSTEIKELLELPILYPGIAGAFGGENQRAGTAHALANAFTSLFPARPSLKKFMHGEWVAFSILVMLYLRKNIDELTRLRKILRALTLPVSFSDFSLGEITEEDLHLVADRTLTSSFFEEEKKQESLIRALLTVGGAENSLRTIT